MGDDAPSSLSFKKRHETSSPSGVLPLSACALQRPPVPDQGLTIAGMVGRPVLFRNGPLQPLDGPRSLERVFLAVEAMHLDAAVVWHHFLETQMGERSEMQQFADRQLDADLSSPGVICSLQASYPRRQQAAPTASPKIQSRAWYR